MFGNKWKDMYEEAQEEIDELKNSLQKLDEEKNALLTKNSEQENYLKQWKKSYDSLKMKHKSELELKETQFLTRIDKLIEANITPEKENDTEIIELQRMNENLMQKLSVESSILEKLEISHDLLKAEHKNMLEEKEGTIKELENQKLNKDSVIQELEKEQLFRDTTIQELERQKIAKDYEIKMLLSEKNINEAFLNSSLEISENKVSELTSEITKSKIESDEYDTKDIEQIKKENTELKALTLEMKNRLDIAETFESIHKIDNYLNDFKRVFQFTNLISLIDKESDISTLLEQIMKEELSDTTKFLPQKEKPYQIQELEKQKKQLERKLERQKKNLLLKLNSLSLTDIFNDTTLENIFKLSKVDDGYSIDAFVSFEEFETILIPKTYRGVNIVKLSEKLFYNCKSFKNLIIEAPISEIPTKCFENSSIESAIISDSVVEISSFAFSNSELNEIILSSNLKKIDDFAFSESKLKRVKLPESITELGDYTFSQTYISEVILPPNLKCLPTGTFCLCELLEKLILNDNLEKIENLDFLSDALNEITIPRNVTFIDSTILYLSSHDTIFKCFPGSYAQQWAREKGLKVKNAEED